MNDENLLKVIFFTLGTIIFLAYFIAVLYYLNKNKKGKKCTCKTYGKVISNVRRDELVGADRIRDCRIRWYSLCEYTVGDTKCVRQTNIGTSQPRKVGEIVTIYYNPDSCHESYIAGDNNSKIKAIVVLILGIIIVVFMSFIIKSIS